MYTEGKNGGGGNLIFSTFNTKMSKVRENTRLLFMNNSTHGRMRKVWWLKAVSDSDHPALSLVQVSHPQYYGHWALNKYLF